MGQLSYSTAQVDNKLTPAYAGIHVHSGAVAQSIPTGATYEKLTAFTDNDPNLEAVPDADNDKITLNSTGVYKVDSSFSMMSGTANATFFVSLFQGGAEVESVHFSRKITIAGDVGSASFSGIINVTTAPVDIDVRARHNLGGAVNFTLTYANLSAVKLMDNGV